MKILVTGGAGFIGSNFLLKFVPQFPDHQFVCVDALTYAGNLKNLEPILSLDNFRFIRADLRDSDSVDTVFDGESPNWVFHFAAESHVDRSIVGPKAFVETNVNGTFHLLQSALKTWRKSGFDDKLFYHVSTDEVFGSLGETGSFEETTPYDPSSPYSASKAASDHLVRAYHRTYGLPVIVSNCSNNYGPLQFPEKLIPLMILNLMESKPLPIYGTGSNVRDWLHVEDHCEAIWLIAKQGRKGETYNIGGNSERTNLQVVDELIRLFAEATDQEIEALTRLKTFVQDRPGHDLRYAINAGKVQNELGWSPRFSFSAGLEQTVKWYLQNQSWVDSVRSGEYLRWIDDHYHSSKTADDQESS